MQDIVPAQPLPQSWPWQAPSCPEATHAVGRGLEAPSSADTPRGLIGRDSRRQRSNDQVMVGVHRGPSSNSRSWGGVDHYCRSVAKRVGLEPLLAWSVVSPAEGHDPDAGCLHTDAWRFPVPATGQVTDVQMEATRAMCEVAWKAREQGQSRGGKGAATNGSGRQSAAGRNCQRQLWTTLAD